MKNIFRLFFVVFCLFATTNPLHAQWIQTNGPYGGNIRVLAVKSNGYVFAGTFDGGIYRSMDNGGTWTNVGFSSISIGALVINSSGTVIAGTARGVYYSDNDGGSWTQIFDLSLNGIISLAINSNGDIFFVNGGGIYRSMDNWNRINNTTSGLTSTDIFTLAINSSNGHIFAGTLSGGVFRSEDNGDHWTQINSVTSGLTNTDVYTLAINSNGDVFAGTISGGVFRSTDNGESWTQKNNGFQSVPTVLFLTFNSSGHVFAGTNSTGVWRSTDSGDHWTQVLNTANNYFYALATKNSDVVYAGTTGTGIFRSADNGGSWNQVNTGLKSTHVTSIAINSSGSIFAGVNASGIFSSADNGGSWMQVTNGPALFIQTQSLAINSNGHIFSGTDQGVYRSTDGGTSWTPLFNSTNFNCICALSISNAAGSNGYIYTGTESGGMFRSTDNGDSWSHFNSGLTNSTVLSLAVNSSGHVFAGTNGGAFFGTTDNGGVFRSIDNGVNWNQTLAGRTVFSLAVYPAGYCFAGTDASIYRSNDDGVTWNQLANSPQGVRSLAISGTNLFAGTYGGGVFLSIDDGTSWTPVNTGLANLNVWSLAISPNGVGGTNIFAGTRGGGVWTRPLSEMTTQQLTVSGTVAYANTVATPIGNATVTLTPATGTPLTTTSSATTGAYTITDVSTGTYTLTAAKAGNWGGVNATDALLVLLHVVGISPLSGLKLMAADVNNSGTVTAVDALYIVLRFVGLISSFPAGDWVFNSQSVTVGTVNVTANISGLAVGDVNASYTPSSGNVFTKPSAPISLKSGADKFSISGISSAALGAVSIKININSAKVANVSSKLPGFVSHVTDSGVSVAWYSQDGKAAQFNANEAIVTVTLAEKAGDNSSITVESDLADITGAAVNIDLAVAVKEIPTVFELSQNYPNPFNPSTQIVYGLPQSGMVTLSVYNMLGQEVVRLVHEQKEAGTYTVQWAPRNLATGVYIYQIHVQTEKESLTSVKRLTLLK